MLLLNNWYKHFFKSLAHNYALVIAAIKSMSSDNKVAELNTKWTKEKARIFLAVLTL